MATSIRQEIQATNTPTVAISKHMCCSVLERGVDLLCGVGFHWFLLRSPFRIYPFRGFGLFCSCLVIIHIIILPIPYCLVPIAYCLLPIAHCLITPAYCLLPIAYCPLPTAYCLLLITFAYCLLPTAYCLLLIAYCPVPVAYCILLLAYPLCPGAMT